MKLELRTKGIQPTAQLAEHAERQVRYAMGRFGDRVRGVRISLVDINGPKGGEDVECRIRAQLTPKGDLVIQERQRDPFSAVSRAAKRASQCVARRMARLHAQRKGRC